MVDYTVVVDIHWKRIFSISGIKSPWTCTVTAIGSSIFKTNKQTINGDPFGLKNMIVKEITAAISLFTSSRATSRNTLFPQSLPDRIRTLDTIPGRSASIS